MNWKLNHQVLKSQTIEIPAREIVFLGPGLILNDCILKNKATARDLTICGVQMNGGEFETKKRLSNFQFKDIEFDNVTFKGAFSGCDFGREKRLAECDFSHAVLDGCRFIGEFGGAIQFPENDHMVLDIETIHGLDIESESSSKLKIFISVLIENQPENLKIVVSHIPSLAKRLKMNENEIVEFAARYA